MNIYIICGILLIIFIISILYLRGGNSDMILFGYNGKKRSSFWSKQKNINLSKSLDDTRITKDLITLSSNSKYEFRNLDILNDSKYLIMVHKFIKNNYTKQQQFSYDYIRWRFRFSEPELMIGLFLKDKNGKDSNKYKYNYENLIGTIFACPTRLGVNNGDLLDVLYITFLCVKRELRGKKIAPILISEMIRRWKNARIYKFPIFVIDDRPLPNMDIEKKLLYKIEPITIFNNYLKDKVSDKVNNKVDNDVVNNIVNNITDENGKSYGHSNKCESDEDQDIKFIKISQNDDNMIEFAYKMYNRLASNEWAVYQYMGMPEFKHYLFNNELGIYTYFITDNKFNKIGLITTVNVSVSMKSGIVKDSSDKIVFIQYILLDNDNKVNSDILLKNKSEFKKNIIKSFMKFLNKSNNKTLKFIAYITDYNDYSNNFISKYVYRKGYVHAYNYSFNGLISNENKYNNGFMMLHL